MCYCRDLTVFVSKCIRGHYYVKITCKLHSVKLWVKTTKIQNNRLGYIIVVLERLLSGNINFQQINGEWKHQISSRHFLQGRQLL